MPEKDAAGTCAGSVRCLNHFVRRRAKAGEDEWLVRHPSSDCGDEEKENLAERRQQKILFFHDQCIAAESHNKVRRLLF